MTYSKQAQIIYQNQDDLDRYQGLKSRILAAKDFTNLSDKDAAQMLLHLGRWEDVRYEAIQQLNKKIQSAKISIISAAEEIVG